MDSKRQQTVLEAVVRFGPREQKKLAQLIPEYNSPEIASALEKLKKRGFVTLEDESKQNCQRIREGDVVTINTDPFNIPDSGQQALVGEVGSERDVISESLPSEIDTDETITFELTPEQTELFERMRTDVSRACGEMSQEEFIDWVFREARRMTEV